MWASVSPVVMPSACNEMTCRTAQQDPDLADFGCDRIRKGTVARVAPPSTLISVTFVAEMIGVLNPHAPLQHVRHRVVEQPAVCGRRHAFSGGLIEQPLFLVVHRRRVLASRSRQLARRVDSCPSVRLERTPSRPTALSCGPPDHAGYKAFQPVQGQTPEGDIYVCLNHSTRLIAAADARDCVRTRWR